MMPRGLLARCVFTAAIVAAASGGGRAQVSQERELKAQALYNFLLFVDWPDDAFANATAAIRICVAGDDDFARTLEALMATRQVKGRSIAITRTVRPESEGCHVLFLPADETDQLRRLTGANKGVQILTVGDTQESVRQGAVIGFYIERNRLRFEINPEAAPRLRISSKLLSLGKRASTAVGAS